MKRVTARGLILLSAAMLMTPALSAQRKASTDAQPLDEFFIISSIDAGRNQLLMKRPTEVTDVMRVDATTRYLDENGKRVALTDLRAGDTVYVVSKPGAGGSVAVEIRKGAMTLSELRKRYLR